MKQNNWILICGIIAIIALIMLVLSFRPGTLAGKVTEQQLLYQARIESFDYLCRGIPCDNLQPASYLGIRKLSGNIICVCPEGDVKIASKELPPYYS